jgi:hypothetical protein
MRYGLFADVIVLVHLLFVLFVMFGVLFALRWPGTIWVHGPALIWGLVVEFADLTCPLTPLENRLRVAAGEAGSREDFLSQWLVTVLYPEFLTRDLSWWIAPVHEYWPLCLRSEEEIEPATNKERRSLSLHR